jgi:hypothetical protein
MLVGDARKIKTVVQNLSANAGKTLSQLQSAMYLTLFAVKYTVAGSISVRCKALEGPKKVQGEEEITLEMVVADTGCGIPTSKLQMIFREFEKVESSGSHSSEETGVGEKSHRCISLGHLFIRLPPILRFRLSSGSAERRTIERAVACRIRSRRRKPFHMLHTARASRSGEKRA